MTHSALTLANTISLSRALLAGPIIWSIHTRHFSLAIAIIILAAMTDALDGYIARKHNAVTPFGKMLDPIADATIMLSVSCYLIWFKSFPLWFFILLTLRYALLSTLALMALRYYSFVMSANWAGKCAVVLIAITLGLHAFDLGSWRTHDLALYTTLFFLFISTLTYIQAFFKQAIGSQDNIRPY